MWGHPHNGYCYSFPASNSGSTEHNPSSEGVALIRSLGIKRVRLLHPDHNLLKALVNTNVEVNLGIPNEDLRDLAFSLEHAYRWVSDNIKPYLSSIKIRYITVGHEGIPGEECRRHLVLPAMQNVQNALDKGDLCIHVSTSVGMDVLRSCYGSLLDIWTPFIRPIVDFLDENESPLTVNVFPNYRYKKKDVFVADRPGSLFCINSFNTAVDLVDVVMKNFGYPNVPILASSTGWASTNGEPVTKMIADALAYNQSLVRHLAKKKGTPKNPKTPIDAYLFTLFNCKRNLTDKLDWGLFDFNMNPVNLS